jgi:hypothetical protein
MRILGLILALGALTWVLYQAAGGGEAETVIPEGHQQALEKAQGVEQTLMESSKKQLQEWDEQQR